MKFRPILVGLLILTAGVAADQEEPIPFALKAEHIEKLRNIPIFWDGAEVGALFETRSVRGGRMGQLGAGGRERIKRPRDISGSSIEGVRCRSVAAVGSKMHLETALRTGGAAAE